MRYRTLGRTGLSVSEIGLGCEHLQGKDYAVVKAAIDEALAQGINIFDIFMSEPQIRTDIGKALAGRREKVLIQGHLGATWKDGQYALSRDATDVKIAFDDLMTRLNTDYIDIGMLHFVDSEKGYDNVFNGPIIELALDLKKKGIIKTIGLGSHNITLSKRAVETGLIDVLMFSLNPAFDIMPSAMSMEDMMGEENAKNSLLRQLNADRMALYQTCEQQGTAITVMKTYMAGRLLDAQKSPFGMALTTEQCIHFSLTRPAVASALIGCITPEEVRAAVAYERATDAQRDFSQVFTSAKCEALGKCVYCNHCLPCPAFIDIAMVNKYLDLAEAADKIPPSVRDHYNAMAHPASDCTACGKCEERCPFAVPVYQRMKKAIDIFGS